MKSVFSSFKNGKAFLVDLPTPVINDDEILIKNKISLISSGTERFLIEFGKSSFIKKALNNRDRLSQVINKIKTNGFIDTLTKVNNKLTHPYRLGYSSVGIVIKKGKGVKNFKLGDRVVSNSFHSEFVKSKENLTAKIPDNVEDFEAIFTVPGSIALHAIRLSKPTLGENYLVVGLGLIGQLTCQILKANGCNVIGVDINRSKVLLAQSNKINAFEFKNNINLSILRTLEGENIDSIIFTSQISKNTIDHYTEICRKKSRLVVVGGGNISFSRDKFYKKELSILVSCSYGPGRYDNRYENDNLDYPIEYVRWTENRNFKSFLKLLNYQSISLNGLRSKNFDIKYIEDAYKAVFDINNIAISLTYSTKSTERDTIYFSKIKKRNNQKDLFVNFIGAGNYTAGTILPILKKIPNLNFNKIYSTSGVSSSLIGKKFGFNLTTTDISRLFFKNEIIFITSTHETHGYYFLKALNKNQHIYIEKPLSVKSEDLEKIKQLYKKKNNVIYIGYNRRFSQFSSIIKNLIHDQDRVYINYVINAQITDNEHWTSKPSNGGRIIGEVCHFIDYCSFILNSEITHWSCSHQNNLNDNLLITLDFLNGSQATINYITHGCEQYPKENIYIYSQKKIIHLIDFKKIKFYGYGILKKNKNLLNQDKGQKRMFEKFFSDIWSNNFDYMNINKIIKENEILIDIKKYIEKS